VFASGGHLLFFKYVYIVTEIYLLDLCVPLCHATYSFTIQSDDLPIFFLNRTYFDSLCAWYNTKTASSIFNSVKCACRISELVLFICKLCTLWTCIFTNLCNMKDAEFIRLWNLSYWKCVKYYDQWNTRHAGSLVYISFWTGVMTILQIYNNKWPHCGFITNNSHVRL
jgi:hypothetical protein